MEETHLCQKSSGKEFCQQVFITAGLRLILDLIYLSYIFPKSPVNDQELILSGDKSDRSFPSNFVSLSSYLLQTVWYHSCLYLSVHFCHSVGSESRSRVFQFCIPFRLQEKELSFIECLLYTKHFSLFYIICTSQLLCESSVIIFI